VEKSYFRLYFTRVGKYELELGKIRTLDLAYSPLLHVPSPVAIFDNVPGVGRLISKGTAEVDFVDDELSFSLTSDDGLFTKTFFRVEETVGGPIVKRYQSLLQTFAVTRIIKRKDEERIVGAAVLIPGVADYHGTVYKGETVRAAAYYFMENYLTDNKHGINLMHRDTLIENAIKIIQNYVTDKKMTFKVEVDLAADTHLSRQRDKVTYPKDTWLLWARILHDGLWEDIKNGKFTGWSPEGLGKLKPLEDVA